MNKIIIGTISAKTIVNAEKPRYNPYQTGHGAHKSAKTYTRKMKHKREEW